MPLAWRCTSAACHLKCGTELSGVSVIVRDTVLDFLTMYRLKTCLVLS